MTAPLLWFLLDEIPPQRTPHVPTRTARPVEHHDGSGIVLGVAATSGTGRATHRPPSENEYVAAGSHGRALAMRVERQRAEDELLLLGLL